MLGEGAAQQIGAILKMRFNLNGQSPPGRKVGMLDEVHLWCLLMDPFSGDWCQKFNIQRNIRYIAERMIAFFVPSDEVG